MSSTLVPLIGPVPGGMEMVVILLIAVLLFGANKIPKLARSTGQAMGEFQRGRQEIEEELQEVQSGGSGSESTLESGSGSTTSTTESESASADSSEAESEDTESSSGN